MFGTRILQMHTVTVVVPDSFDDQVWLPPFIFGHTPTCAAEDYGCTYQVALQDCGDGVLSTPMLRLDYVCFSSNSHVARLTVTLDQKKEFARRRRTAGRTTGERRQSPQRMSRRRAQRRDYAGVSSRSDVALVQKTAGVEPIACRSCQRAVHCHANT